MQTHREKLCELGTSCSQFPAETCDAAEVRSKERRYNGPMQDRCNEHVSDGSNALRDVVYMSMRRRFHTPTYWAVSLQAVNALSERPSKPHLFPPACILQTPFRAVTNKRILEL